MRRKIIDEISQIIDEAHAQVSRWPKWLVKNTSSVLVTKKLKHKKDSKERGGG